MARLDTSFAVVLPTLNASPFLSRLFAALKKQSAQPNKIIILDSSSTDGSPEAFIDFGAEVHSIPRASFDHGGTRQLGVTLTPGVDVVLYLTQDAIPADSCAFARLLEAFDDPQIAVAYGRQLPHPGASPVATEARRSNYPSVAAVHCLRDIERIGVRAAFCSDCFAAYRRELVLKVGGFPSPVIWGEDLLLAAKLMMDGWYKAYVPQACVFHSHDYSLREYFRNSFDTGVMNACEKWFVELVGGVQGEGVRTSMAQLASIAQSHPTSLPYALASLAARYLGYQCGRHFPMIPTELRGAFTRNRNFWRAEAPNGGMKC